MPGDLIKSVGAEAKTEKKKGDDAGINRAKSTKVRAHTRKNRRELSSISSRSSDADHASLDGRRRRHQNKKRPSTSKDCEKIVARAVAEFWDSAWVICVERFFITSAATTVSVDLRNSWLRIVEAEWLDREFWSSSGDDYADKIFMQCDQAPLPLALDSWSRGAIELLPAVRRESVLDPFLRDVNDRDGGPLTRVGHVTSSDEQDVLKKDETEDGNGQEGFSGLNEQVVEMDPADVYDEWNFDLDQQYKHNYGKRALESVRNFVIAPSVSESKIV